MEIGISTACFYPTQTEDTIPVIADIGCSLCEVFFESDCEYEKDFTSLLKERLVRYNIRANSVHAFCATFENQIFSDYERRRSDALKVARKVLEGAADIGAKSYTFHGDRRTDSLDNIDYCHYGRCFDELADMAKDYGIIIAWENVAWCQSSRPEFIKRVIETVKTDNIKFTLDIKQARRANTDINEYIKVMGEGIVNVHINDYNETQTCMLPGRGKVDFKSFFEKLEKVNYKGNAIIEVYSSDFENVSELKCSLEYLKGLMHNCDIAQNLEQKSRERS